MSTEQRVIQLVIDASGVEAGERRAAAAYDHLGDRAEAATAKAQAAFQKQIQIFEQRVPKSIDAVASAYDRVRASVDPVIAVQMKLEQQMTRSLQSVNRAVLLGVTTQEQANADIARLRSQQVVQINEVREAQERLNLANRQGVVPANQTVPHTGSFQTANVAAQFQDIGVTAAMGMSPLMIALQQGTQLSAVLGPMGAAGAVKSLGAAFLSLISPVSLVTIALIAGTVAAVQYFMSSKKEAEGLDAVLERHQQNIRDIRGSWGEAAAGVQDYVAKSKPVIEAENVIAGFDLKQQLKKFTDKLAQSGTLFETEADRIKSALSDVQAAMQLETDPTKLSTLGREFDLLFGKLDGADTVILKATGKFAPLKGAIDAFAESARKGTPDYIALQTAIAQGLLADPANEQLIKLNKEVGGLIQNGVKLQSALEGNASAFDKVASAIARSAENLKAYVSAIDAMSQIATPAMSDLDKATKAYDEALRLARTEAEVRLAEDQYGATKRRISDQNPTIDDSDGRRLTIPTPGEKPNQLSDEPSKAAAKTADAYRDLIKSGNDRIEQMRLEGQMFGMTGIAAQGFRLELDLLQKAQEKGRTVTPKQREEIKALADAYRDAATEVAKLKLASDLQFDFDQTFRSNIDQQIAQSQRGVGLPVDLNSDYANAARELQQLKDLRAGIGGFFQDFRDGLMQGDSIGKAFGTALLNAMNNVLTKLTDSLINDVVNALTGAGSSGGGILGKFLGAALKPANDNVAASAAAVPISAVAKSALPSTDIAAYISQAAAQRGIDPAIALRVAQSEGGLKSWNLQSNYFKNGVQEPSFGPFQLYKGGGLGNAFQKQTGLDPALASSGPAGVDFALDHASKNGWGAWYGAGKAGISKWQGIGANDNSDTAAAALDKLATGGQAASDNLSKFGDTAGATAGQLQGSVANAAKGLDGLGGGMSRFGQALATAQSGGGGGLLSLLGSLTGFGQSVFNSSGQFASAILSGGVGLYDRGGWTGPGARNKPAGIVHADEIVWSQDDIRRHGGVAVVEAKRLGYPGYEQGGIVGRKSPSLPPPRIPANDVGGRSSRSDGGEQAARMDIHIHGARGNAEIEEMVDRGVRSGIAEYDKKMPDRVLRINKSPRKRA